MNTIISNRFKFLGIAVLIVVFSSVILVAYPSGFTGRTLKTSTAGCGSCHTFNTNVTGQITGPDTVNIGQTVLFSITVTDPARNKAGVDIAAVTGLLAPGPSSADIKLVSGELTHLHAITMTNHTVTKQFNYTATASPGVDTIFATVTSGTPAWNWAPSKRIVIKNITSVTNTGTVSDYKLNQNYPNPFNPSTNIAFEVPKTTELKIKVFDIIGNEVATVIDSKLERGSYNIKWDGSNYSSGVYFYKLITPDFETTKKMILTK